MEKPDQDAIAAAREARSETRGHPPHDFRRCAILQHPDGRWIEQLSSRHIDADDARESARWISEDEARAAIAAMDRRAREAETPAETEGIGGLRQALIFLALIAAIASLIALAALRYG